MIPTVRVYVNGEGADVPAGATALAAVDRWNAEAAEGLRAGRARLTDSRGLPADLDAPVWGGAIYRVVSVRAGGTDEPLASP